MVVGFDGSRAFLKGRTGTENYSYQLLKALAKTSAENIYMVYVRSGAIINRNEWPRNFKFITINLPILWTQVGLAWRTLIDPIDLLFVPAHTLPLIRKPGLKTVMTVHDLGAEFLPAMHQLKQRIYLSWITKFQLKTATKLIAVSQATKNDLIAKVGINPSQIEVIYEGVDREVFKPVKDLSRAKSRDDTLINSLKHFELKPEGYFLFVGTIQPRKNLRRLIEAFNLFLTQATSLIINHQSQPKLVLVGSKGWLSDEIYQLPEKLRIQKQVRFLGRINDQDLVALYSGAIALVFPSLYEGFGLPILEAMSCHCPVITSQTSSMPEVAGQAALYVNPYKVEEIAEAMKKLTTDNILRDRLIEKGYKQAEKFSWERCARETVELFEGMSKK